MPSLVEIPLAVKDFDMFIIIIIIRRRNNANTISLQTSFGDLIIIRNGTKKISLKTLFGDLIRNRASTTCLLKLHLGDIIRNGANTTRYDIIWLPNNGYQFATSLSTWKPNFSQIGGFLYFGGPFWFKMATIANQNGRHMVQHVLFPVNIHFH